MLEKLKLAEKHNEPASASSSYLVSEG